MSTPLGTTKLFNGVGRRVAHFYVRRLMRSDVEWETDLPLGAKIIAANHPTTTDPFLMMSWPFGPVYILITETAFKVPLIGRFLCLAGHIPVYAQRGREAFEVALHLLEDQTVGIFPEGTLSSEHGQLVTARSGAVRLAATAQVPIIPAGIAPDWHFVAAVRQLQRIGVTEKVRWFGLGAYEVSVGMPLVFKHAADDREAVKQSTEILIEEIERLMERSAKRLSGCKPAFVNPYGGSIGTGTQSTSECLPIST